MQNNDGIVLLAKGPGVTSFSSLNNVKKSLHTTKVGHTGTLDSFAQGLLVVCTGKMTKLVSHITEFDKSYSAVIKFGEETDTLEFTGNVVKKAGLPTLEALKDALGHFTGELLQAPPAYSAVHVDGHRASDLARRGIEVEIPKRKINVFSAELKEVELAAGTDNVLYARVDFSVSKGTYIRCLARDIADACGSTGHLVGLLRTKVGNFTLNDAAGLSLLEDFSIASAKKTAADFLKIEAEKTVTPPETQSKKQKTPYIPTEEDLLIQKEIQFKMQTFSEETSLLCGFNNIHLKMVERLADFKNGKKLFHSDFDEAINAEDKKDLAVFYKGTFCGLLESGSNKKLYYKFVAL
ncbi:tRNA pseudouridine(55) synthase TruB [Treponema sp. C6A8]|uniref:tRNA pseudouridine(55) synthase TruB n=1 Tax=Treponema sp. C6A8 TaxID=1410609 RepID=UPI0006878ECA|nr:tRNA pseudouridine(55) synthase TruB [Treponema sp. C6A8]